MDFHVERLNQSTILTFLRIKARNGIIPMVPCTAVSNYSMADSAMEAAPTCCICGKAVLTLDLGMNYLRPAFANTVIRADPDHP